MSRLQNRLYALGRPQCRHDDSPTPSHTQTDEFSSATRPSYHILPTQQAQLQSRRVAASILVQRHLAISADALGAFLRRATHHFIAANAFLTSATCTGNTVFLSRRQFHWYYRERRHSAAHRHHRQSRHRQQKHHIWLSCYITLSDCSCNQRHRQHHGPPSAYPDSDRGSTPYQQQPSSIADNLDRDD